MVKEIPLKPANERFTDTQWQAIFDGEDNLLVSASAGSGKTTVLVRRVIEALNRGQAIDRMLIVTFTEAAANEMKERLHEALQKAINHETDEVRRQHYLAQLMKLPAAQISTLHSFCLSVIRKYYYLIDLDPNFRLLSDETEKALLMEESWQNLLEEKYASEDPRFYQLAEAFANDRSDEGITELIMGLYRFSRANAHPNKWLANLVKSYATSSSLASQPIFKEYLQPMLLDVLKEMQNYLTLAQSIVQPTSLVKVQECLADDQMQVSAIVSALETQQVETAYELIQQLSFKRYPSVRSDNEESAFSVQAKIYRESAKENIELLKELWMFSPEETLQLLAQCQPIVQEAAELTKQFIQAFNQLKLEKSVLDFNDLEHYALAILVGENERSVASEYYRNTFDEVLIDEYQDVNRLQEAILYWVSKPTQPGNTFMVGDVKQSIYAFRQADPTLFIEKYLQFGKNENGRRIILAENFRSRKEVLDFTNFIFEQLMDEKVGQIAYDEAAQLKHGFPNFPASDQFDTELLLYLNDQVSLEEESSEWTIDTKAQGELMIVAKKIRDLIDTGYQIYDKKLQKNRPVTYRDFVILTPTRKNHLTLIDLFAQLKIPVELADAQNYFQATEVQLILALLQVIDNPLQDIPLAAVLRSPMVGLNEQDLAQIRLVTKSDYFYEALIEALSYRFTFSEKIQTFVERLKRWRKMARTDSIETLLWAIYDETGFLDYVGGMASGLQRQTNLLAFINRAQAYEQSSFKGVYQFVRFIQKMQEKANDLAKPVSEIQEDAVRVMTIHASKGLEFPIVFVVDLAKRFNYKDIHDRYVLDEHLGAGIKYRDNEYVQYPSLPYVVIKQIKLQKMLSEEMRKLYVALTRAEQKLYLVGTYASKEQALKEWRKALAQEEQVLSANLRLSKSGNFLNWLGYCLIRHPQTSQYFDEAIERHKTMDHPANFKIIWFTDEELTAQMDIDRSADLSAAEDEGAAMQTEDIAQLKHRLAYQYPYIRSTMTANYQSVSELKRMYEDPDEQHLNKLVWQDRWQQEQKQALRFVSDELAKPKFNQKTPKKLFSGAEIGTATHKLLQLLPLNQKIDESFLKDFTNKLVDQGVFTNEIVSQLRFEHILWFLASDLGQRMLEHTNELKREVPFAMLREASQIFEEFTEQDASVLIHGVIDGFFIEDEAIVLFDFKTDYFPDKNEVAQQAKKRYYGQLKLYAQALQEAYNLPVKEVYLVLLNHQKIISC
ncbi:helicase-exonuclease AddAB subunit AddA [Enterococcus columbae]|uniref:ATP-dependent helicase/nuclease subunit A n=1 Tax=Enterococcus columbae DSM 7374 = ATCC 51263 TaxID=1121865 RepID=S0KHZ8_9ENTE|nr:helicase-exonuclease AddAB subunit AddA [Enterococcus columbae]EOT44444.1 helicase-exonuclease AddAB, AddA subunit [Enterococcus columbae DSM 7374 = ATCC 51263]EOW84602.1 helicase-exonuclease AddAB, AddA subunit [Enterococcus columbae DSM 7374 = ATCC 51263]OJG21440.1 helicase-exonuclease AddAB, AddA subunit [Enterococcus columbae DSM 7374 = ATCC 51263]